MTTCNKNTKLKETTTWRIIVGNINSFPGTSGKNNPYKLDRFKKLVMDHGGDIIVISEHNKNMNATKNHNKPAEIVKKWWPNTITRSSNLSSTNSNQFEPGGTMIITHSRSTAHTCAHGEDTHQLGRWNYITIRGKREHYTTIISIYRPSKQQETFLRQTAYTAKRRKTIQVELPDSIWFSDLKQLMQEKMQMGHEILVAGDFNDNLNQDNSLTRTFMYNMGLRELMIENLGQGPPTYIRGSTKIDGIFATTNLRLNWAKYTTFEQSPSDHRWMIIDIPEHVLIGTARDDKKSPLMRKCTSTIPSVVANFQQLVESQVIRYGLLARINDLYNTAIQSNSFSPKDEQEYEIIEERMKRAIKYADARCRKARTG
jgi:exonuclease III